MRYRTAIPSSRLPTFKYTILVSENHRNVMTTAVKNTTLAIALINSASPLTEKIRPKPLIIFNFSVLKLKLFGLKDSPFPTND